MNERNSTQHFGCVETRLIATLMAVMAWAGLAAETFRVADFRFFDDHKFKDWALSKSGAKTLPFEMCGLTWQAELTLVKGIKASELCVEAAVDADGCQRGVAFGDGSGVNPWSVMKLVCLDHQGVHVDRIRMLMQSQTSGDYEVEMPDGTTVCKSDEISYTDNYTYVDQPLEITIIHKGPDWSDSRLTLVEMEIDAVDYRPSATPLFHAVAPGCGLDFGDGYYLTVDGSEPSADNDASGVVVDSPVEARVVWSAPKYPCGKVPVPTAVRVYPVDPSVALSKASLPLSGMCEARWAWNDKTQCYAEPMVTAEGSPGVTMTTRRRDPDDNFTSSDYDDMSLPSFFRRLAHGDTLDISVPSGASMLRIVELQEMDPACTDVALHDFDAGDYTCDPEADHALIGRTHVFVLRTPSPSFRFISHPAMGRAARPDAVALESATVYASPRGITTGMQGAASGHAPCADGIYDLCGRLLARACPGSLVVEIKDGRASKRVVPFNDGAFCQ